MRAARLYRYDPELREELKLEQTPDPQIRQPDEVIVRVVAAGLCRTDLHIIEGIWRDILDPQGTLLPYTPGHENTGIVEAVGSAVTAVKPGDRVICHPLRSCGVCLACRAGEDMYCANGRFPGLDSDGGFAEYLVTNQRAVVKLPAEVDLVEVAPLADAGLTAYRAAKRAARSLPPDGWGVVIGIGGLGHIALQVLRAFSSARLIAVDVAPAALERAREFGADHVLRGGPELVAEIRELTGGGAHAVLDFVGERGVEQQGWQMLRKGGMHLIIGYGGRLEIPTVHMIFQEIAVAGSLVGNYRELTELMDLAARGIVRVAVQRYSLDEINRAIDDFKHGRYFGRAVIVP
ncbi:MAG: NAD(P)-dependent alcohol dehydrogenase [Thermomicrobium sp.]|nr:NAD(P)-dependent alcohol dehydrogenase [Thermomicrobium sp.]